MNYIYSCKTADGKIENGIIDAPSPDAAVKLLSQKQLFILDLRQEGDSLEKKGLNLNIPFLSKRVSIKDKIIFTQQLSMMIKAGLPLLDAFTALEEQTENKYFAGIIHDIAQDVKGGKLLSETLAKNPKIFNTLYTATVASGEKSGKLDEVLERLSDQLQKDYDLISKIRAAVSYPILVVTALIGIMILMFIFVIPKLKSVFADMGATLPLITRIILGISDVFSQYWYVLLILILVIYFGVRIFSRTKKGRLTIDRLILKTPMVGSLMKEIYMTRFARTMGTLVASGLPMLDIIATVKYVINNRVYQDAFENISTEIESGVPLSEALKKQKIFPAMIYHLVSVGEKSGKLDYVLLSMANFFDKEIENKTSNLATFIEPVLIIIIGAGVGVVVASVLMPIYSLVNTI